MASMASQVPSRRQTSVLGYIRNLLCQYNHHRSLTGTLNSNAIHLKMRNLPQEIVDMIIDQLAEEAPCPFEVRKPMSTYSTVSRQWVEGTRKHHFRCIEFRGPEGMEKWRTAFEADPLGISRHVRKLIWTCIDTLQGFDEHIRAFTQVKEVDLVDGWIDGGIPNSLPEVQTFAILGSNLVRLQLEYGTTTPHNMVSLLAGLPRLRHLLAYYLEIKCDTTPPVFPLSIPFFEGGNALSLWKSDCSSSQLGWIPPTARFSGLRVDPSCIHHCPALVNQWVASSGERLKWFSVMGDLLKSTCLDLSCPALFSFTPLTPLTVVFFPSGFRFDRLDLSRCTSLNYLRLPIPINRPELFANNVLPSISSSRLTTVMLELGPPVDKENDNDGWVEIEKHLCRLAKQFKAAHGGRKMEVMICVPGQHKPPIVFYQLQNRWPMPDLKKEANTGILMYDDPLLLGPEPWYQFHPWARAG